MENKSPLFDFLKKFAYFILALSLGSFLLYLLYVLLELLNIDISVYGNFIIWIIAMALFKFTLSDRYTESPWLKE